ncbi:sodium-dependent transporter [Gordonia sp. Z-3]|uniref:Sodium-dependent transporter n=1 Tax=Gordonia tangerina TaxID=2911060 RepID=A0ABS9DR40_9ACTN|nr:MULTISPECIES: sodium-dependent transporter [Gordonia]MAU84383.1 sodium-dependent transporter [Gordonia sp. (in: high G+C Gram-positive bacteria)]MCF3940278.1 sodium-dependent transporter [Gordonia tangerina]MED5799583.1 sodium-dependent transporter [Gordonia sp. Z-3]
MANPDAGTANRETWTRNSGFILAAIGSAVGLGNIWRFPGVAYESGGGAFIVPYLCALLTAGIPILFLDYAIGHRYRAVAPLAFRRIRRHAEAIGWFQTGLLFVIGVYYAAVIAWAMSYFVYSFDLRWGEDTQTFFLSDYLQVGDPEISTTVVGNVALPLVIVWLAILAVLCLGVARGVEKINMVFIPLLFVGFAGLVVRAVTLPGAADGLNALFSPDWSALSDLDVWIAAYSQIFFSLSIAFGIMIAYSSFQRRKANMTSSGLVVAFANSSFEILAGIGVFGALGFLAYQQQTAISDLEGLTGPILSFVTFPAVISEMPGASFWGALFFGSLVVAGFTSLISLLIGVSSSLQEKFGLSRVVAAVITAGVSGVISIGLFSTTSGLIALDTVDQFANNIGVVSSAIIMTVFTVWLARDADLLRRHLNAVSTFQLGRWWIALIGVVGPVFLTVMLVQKIISIINDGYEGYPQWYLGVFGWGTIALLVVGAVALTLPSWRGRDYPGFQPWPPLDTKPEKEAVR